jgi:Xaa-Pro aminopeptidase
MSKFQLSTQEIKDNISSLQKYMKDKGLDAFYISSFDAFLNEYVPMNDCHRYYLTGFSGSTAESLVPAEGKVKLYVDGRYHEQADIECADSLIEVVKVPANTGLITLLKKDLKDLNVKKVGIEGNRTSVAFFDELEEKYSVTAFHNNELASIISFAKLPELKPISHLSTEVAGTSTKEKLKRIFSSNSEAHFVTAIDSLAWITNCRGYHLPNLSSFLGVGLVTSKKVYVFVDQGVEHNCADDMIQFISGDVNTIKETISKLSKVLGLDKVYIDKKMLNSSLFLMLKDVFGTDKLEAKVGGLIDYHSIKDDAELTIIKDSFKRSNRAIFNTICWVKNAIKEGQKISELDLYDQTTIEYNKQGAVDQSFGTIAGVGANGSIIHYSDPKKDVIIEDDDMILLDSGGYFEAGFATDTTRTFLSADKAKSEKYKEIYTLVLKGTLNLQNAVFKEGTRGSGLDAICRQPLYQAGYDYAHGTGHGVGIHVHEGGVGISPVRNYLMKPGQVVSIEPGIYIPGFGGVRLENIAIVIDHPKYEGFMTFENLVYIGFEPNLINESMLNEQEKVWLKDYEAECTNRGNSFLS